MAIRYDGNLRIYQCDRCGEQVNVLATPDAKRNATRDDPLNQRDHDPPVGWVIASLQLVNHTPVILGPHGGNALWCKDCGGHAELFAKGRQLSDIY